MLLPLWLDIAVAFLLAYNVRQFAVALGVPAGALIALLVAIGAGNAWLMPPLQAIELAGGAVYLWAHAAFCGLAAWVSRGFLNGSIQRWWRLL